MKTHPVFPVSGIPGPKPPCQGGVRPARSAQARWALLAQLLACRGVGTAEEARERRSFGDAESPFKHFSAQTWDPLVRKSHPCKRNFEISDAAWRKRGWGLALVQFAEPFGFEHVIPR